MGRIKSKYINKLLKEKNIVLSNNKNFYLYVYIDVEDGIGTFNINNNFENNISISLTEFINESEYKNVVLIARGNQEQFSTAFPSTNEIKFLKQNIKKNLRIFYQEPWPTPVPEFINDDTTLFIRFGFDEGSDFDKMCVKEPTFKTKKEEGNYFFLLNKKQNILLGYE